MTSAFPFWLILLLAYCLDRLLGDPKWLPHPIRWMGWAISSLESHFRKLPVPLILSGSLFTFFLVSGAWLLTYASLHSAQIIHPFLKPCLEVVIIYFSLSIQSLAETAGDVLEAIEKNRLSDARNRVTHLVGRDTDSLDAHGIARGTVESVAENFVDGVVSPLFYAAVGGAPLAMAFKMVNTLDSMVGYKNKKYEQFGKPAARLDDAANFIPSRFSVSIIALCAQLLFKKGRTVLKISHSEGSLHPSPNAGRAEAAFAGALGVWLNGPNYYGGKLVSKPIIGKGLGETYPEHIRKACDLMLFASLLCIIFFSGLHWVL